MPSSGLVNGIILNFIGSLSGIYTQLRPVGYPALYLFYTRLTSTAGVTDWHQYPRMDAQKN